MCNLIHAQHFFLNDFRGQFFEQGYGGAYDEEALDILITPSRHTVLCGWQESPETDRKDFTLWYISEIGKLLREINYPHPVNHSIATAIAPLSAGHWVLAGRITSADYRPGIYVELNDSLRVIRTDATGAVHWSYVYGERHLGIAAADVVTTPDDHSIVVCNTVDPAGHYGIRIIMLDPSGNPVYYTEYQNPSVSRTAHEILYLPHHNAYLISTNNYENQTKYPGLLAINTTGSTIFDIYFQIRHDHLWYGLDYLADGTVVLAGYTWHSGDTNSYICHYNINVHSITHEYEWGTDGSEKLRDVVVTPTGYVCLGIRNNQGEGGDDIYLAHFDASYQPILEETMGTAEHERANSKAIRPQPDPVVQLAGYCSGFGIQESGQAYLGAAFFVEPSTMLNNSCVVPRILYLDDLIYDMGESCEWIEFGLLDTHATNIQVLDQIIQFCKNNKFNMLSIYNLECLFYPNLDIITQEEKIKRIKAYVNLKKFLDRCRKNGIFVGYVAENRYQSLDTVLKYEMGHNSSIRFFNYTFHGKFNYLHLEHEFWNAHHEKYEKPIFSNTNYIKNTDTHFVRIYNDHLILLNKMVQAKNTQPNIWRVFDYVDKFWNSDPLSQSFTLLDSIPRRNKTHQIADLVDAVLLSHYKWYDSLNGHYGKNFLFPWINNQNQIIDWQNYGYRLRLSDFADSTKRHTIIPLFSAEYYYVKNNKKDTCGSNDFLGRFLAGPLFNFFPNITFRAVEDTFRQQYNVCYKYQKNLFPHLFNVRIAGYGWFTHSCLSYKNYSNLFNDLQSCDDTINIHISLTEWTNSTKNKNIVLYPNPASDKIYWHSDEIASSIEIVSLSGVKLWEDKKLSANSVTLPKLSSGMYLVIIREKADTYITKLIISHER